MRKLLYILIFLFFSFSFDTDSPPPPGGWYQQFLPDVNNMPISDIEFLDSLVGFAVTGDGSGGDTNFILKTTNGGDNWFISYIEFRNFERIIFINDNVGYICGGQNDVIGALYKTTNSGGNWNRLSTPFAHNFNDMSVLNEDTIWVVDDNSFNGGVFRTTNGGQSWTQQYFAASFPGNPDHIYMLNGNTGFISTAYLFKTTNSGLNWTAFPSESGFADMFFIDSLTGWKVKSSYVKKTTVGGLNWQTQTRPTGGMLLTNSFYEFSEINKDTIWGVGGTIRYGPYNYRGIIWQTTNGGTNWGFQIPDTNIHIVGYWQTDFINKLNGWAYHVGQGGVHTVTGGNDSTFYTGLIQVSNEIPKGFVLYQNYPNPFNPSTRIKFELPKNSFLKLIVYDISGREIIKLVDKNLTSGSYETEWIGYGYPSGVYFYRLSADGNVVETRKMVLIK